MPDNGPDITIDDYRELLEEAKGKVPWPQILEWLCHQCEKHGVSLVFEYRAGLVVDVVTGKQYDAGAGYAIEIGLTACPIEDGKQRLYRSPTEAIVDGAEQFPFVVFGIGEQR